MTILGLNACRLARSNESSSSGIRNINPRELIFRYYRQLKVFFHKENWRALGRNFHSHLSTPVLFKNKLDSKMKNSLPDHVILTSLTHKSLQRMSNKFVAWYQRNFTLHTVNFASFVLFIVTMTRHKVSFFVSFRLCSFNES